MDISTIKAAIEQLRPQLNEKAAIWFAPQIPEEVIAQHQKKYLDLQPGETPLIVVNKKAMLFTGFCITDKRLVLRLEGKVGIASGLSRKSIEYKLDDINTISCLLNLDQSERILVNNQNLGYVYQMSQESGLNAQNVNKIKDEHYRILDLLFNALSGASAELTDADVNEIQSQSGDNVDEVKPLTAPVGPTYVEQQHREVKRSKIAGLISTYFVDTIKSHYVDFKGKATRSDFWYFALCQFLFLSGISGICELLFGGGVISYYVLSLALCLPALAVTVRRLHDIGKSGWMLLIVLIPLVGAIWLIVLLCKKGETTPRRHNVLPVDYIILLVSAVFGFLWYEQMATDSADLFSDATEYNYSDATKSKPAKKIRGKWFPIYEAEAVPDYNLNRLFAVGSNDKKDIDSDGLGYYGTPAIIYAEINGKKDVKWKALLLFSDISEAYQDMHMDLIPASFNSNILYFNYNFNGEDGCGHSGKVDVTTGKFDLFEGRIMGMITEGSYENTYLKDMGSYWELYQQSGIGESGAPLAKLNPYDFRRVTEDDIISWIEGQ